MVLRTKPERKEEKDRTREELLRAALRLAAVHGFAGLGLREVAREAGIAPTSFYRHFEDMQALGLALVRDKVGAFLLACIGPPIDLLPEPSPLVDALFHAVDGDPELARFILAERVGASQVLRAALREACAALAPPLLGALSIHRRSRALLDAGDLVTVLLLDAAAQLLDATAESRAALRRRTLQRLEAALAQAIALGRES